MNCLIDKERCIPIVIYACRLSNSCLPSQSSIPSELPYASFRLSLMFTNFIPVRRSHQQCIWSLPFTAPSFPTHPSLLLHFPASISQVPYFHCCDLVYRDGGQRRAHLIGLCHCSSVRPSLSLHTSLCILGTVVSYSPHCTLSVLLLRPSSFIGYRQTHVPPVCAYLNTPITHQVRSRTGCHFNDLSSHKVNLIIPSLCMVTIFLNVTLLSKDSALCISLAVMSIMLENFII